MSRQVTIEAYSNFELLHVKQNMIETVASPLYVDVEMREANFDDFLPVYENAGAWRQWPMRETSQRFEKDGLLYFLKSEQQFKWSKWARPSQPVLKKVTRLNRDNRTETTDHIRNLASRSYIIDEVCMIAAKPLTMGMVLANGAMQVVRNMTVGEFCRPDVIAPSRFSINWHGSGALPFNFIDQQRTRDFLQEIIAIRSPRSRAIDQVFWDDITIMRPQAIPQFSEAHAAATYGCVVLARLLLANKDCHQPAHLEAVAKLLNLSDRIALHLVDPEQGLEAISQFRTDHFRPFATKEECRVIDMSIKQWRYIVYNGTRFGMGVEPGILALLAGSPAHEEYTALANSISF
jgi:hypothetical protein